MATLLLFLELAVVVAMIYLGAKVAAIGFDRTGTTHIGKYVVNHSFQLPGFITTFVSIGLGLLIASFL